MRIPVVAFFMLYSLIALGDRSPKCIQALTICENLYIECSDKSFDQFMWPDAKTEKQCSNDLRECRIKVFKKQCPGEK